MPKNVSMDVEEPLKRIVDTAFSQISALTREERDRARQEGLEQGRREGRQEAEQQTRAAVDAAVAAARTGAPADSGIDRLVAALRSIDEARSLTEVLTALVDAAAREAGRAAVFIVRSRALTGWRLKGFDASGDGGLEISFQDAGVMTDAVRSKTAVASRSGAQSGVPAFANAAGSVRALACPIAIAGEAVAVVYADDGASGDRSAALPPWQGKVEILTRHAARCLEALTAFSAARSFATQTSQPSHSGN